MNMLVVCIQKDIHIICIHKVYAKEHKYFVEQSRANLKIKPDKRNIYKFYFLWNTHRFIISVKL